MPGGRRLCLVVPIALLLAVSARAFAWTDPVSVSSPDARVLWAGIDSTGRATVAWNGHGVQARARRPDGSLGFIKTVGNGSASQFSTFAMDGGGNSYFIWNDSDGTNSRLNYRSMSPTGTFGPTVPISPPGGDAADPRLAVNASGQAIVGWTLQVRNPSGPGAYRFIQVRSVAPNGVPGPIQTVDPYEQSSLRDVAIDPSGDATIIWERKAGLAAIQRTSGGTLGPLIPVDADVFDAHVAMDSGGNATLLYERGEDLVARQLSSAGLRGPRLPVAALDHGDFTFGLDGAGTALIVWTQGFEAVPRDRTLSPSGTLGPVQVLSASMGREPALGINSSGDSVIAWRAQTPGNFNWQVQAVQRAADGDVGPTERISAAGPRVDDPRVALNDSGQAITAWDARRVEISAGP